jgi:hypothetical protein
MYYYKYFNSSSSKNQIKALYQNCTSLDIDLNKWKRQQTDKLVNK